MLTACSNDDSESEQTTTKIEAGKTYYMTVNAKKGGDTRALTLDGSTMTVTWDTDENVYVQYDGSWFTGKLHPTANSNEAWLSGAITPGTSVTLPAAMVTLQFPRQDFDYTEQDGTLKKISTHYDYATTTAEITGITEDYQLIASEFVTFQNQQAIVKFTLQDEKGDALNVSSLRISATNLKTTDSSTGDITIQPSSATNVLFAALSGIEDTQVTLTATTTNGTYYVYRKDRVTFADGKYRPITVKMPPSRMA
ncbi:MAG: hypothetical protein IJ693_01240 [Bacteroidaceae bacterium]|nr:hypothetical protein [Bacteroidaceae bacterium]